MLMLASKSPRRRELLRQIGVEFQVVDVDVPEVYSPEEKAVDYVCRLASDKSKAGFLQCQRLTLGADTIVVADDVILEKPQNCDEAVAMLKRLSGRTHQVYTAIALTDHERHQCVPVCTHVTFGDISQALAERYWRTGEPCDKAGGYGIQGFGAVFVSGIEGSYSNVVGLPLRELSELLGQFNVPVWNGE